MPTQELIIDKVIKKVKVPSLRYDYSLKIYTFTDESNMYVMHLYDTRIQIIDAKNSQYLLDIVVKRKTAKTISNILDKYIRNVFDAKEQKKTKRAARNK